MRYNLAFEGSGPVLAGANNGKVAFGSIVRSIDKEPPTPTPLFLDFKDVEVATASFLRESIFALKLYLRSVRSNIYPVVANSNEAVYEELLLVANARGDAIICCDLSAADKPSEIGLIGQLDPKQQETFDLVNELKIADAIGLMEKYDAEEDKKSPTKWNNRLAGLASRGLILEFSRGRAKYYRPVLEVTE